MTQTEAGAWRKGLDEPLGICGDYLIPIRRVCCRVGLLKASGGLWNVFADGHVSSILHWVVYSVDIKTGPSALPPPISTKVQNHSWKLSGTLQLPGPSVLISLGRKRMGPSRSEKVERFTDFSCRGGRHDLQLPLSQGILGLPSTMDRRHVFLQIGWCS